MLPEGDDQVIYDLSARYDAAIKRVERLETLEFGTTAFPSGGVFVPICDAKLIVSTAVITFCIAPVVPLTGFRHLFAVMSYYSTLGVPFIPPKLNLIINGDFGAVYLNYTRQEDPVGPPFITDTEVPPIGFGTDTKISLPRPAQDNPIGVETPTTCMVLFPGYDRVGNVKTVAWWGFSNPETTTGANTFTGDQGGGEYRRFVPAPGPITTISMFHPPPGLIKIGSRFTLYGMP